MGTCRSPSLNPLGTKASNRRVWQGTEVEMGRGAAGESLPALAEAGPTAASCQSRGHG